MRHIFYLLFCFLVLGNQPWSIVCQEDQKKCTSIVDTHGKTIHDCNCDYDSVNEAVTDFFSPLLREITSRTFFRYFFVDLERNCPFWQEDGVCMNEGCSVCTCEEAEIPKPWIESIATAKNQYNSIELKKQSDSLGKLDDTTPPPPASLQSHLDLLSHLSESTRWIDMSESEDCQGEGMARGQRGCPQGVFVNLLQNPEGFTGYSGPSATRVWRSIQEENCFGSNDDQCLEKRVFYRVMSGLQASISTHIARHYLYLPEREWGANVPFFSRTVGQHPDRLNNLYFAFLFLLRATSKASEALAHFPYHTGNNTEDEEVRRLIQTLVGAGKEGERLARSLQTHGEESETEGMGGCRPGGGGGALEGWGRGAEGGAPEQCRNGFDESALFQEERQSSSFSTPYLSFSPHTPSRSPVLKEEFRQRFRNVSRIMDCVTCEKCRVWGKLQILGIGTAVRLLLSSEEDLAYDWGDNGGKNLDLQGHTPSSPPLSRQEVVALVNTLHQLARSVEFAVQVRTGALKGEEERWRDRSSPKTGSPSSPLFPSSPKQAGLNSPSSSEIHPVLSGLDPAQLKWLVSGVLGLSSLLLLRRLTTRYSYSNNQKQS